MRLIVGIIVLWVLNYSYFYMKYLRFLIPQYKFFVLTPANIKKKLDTSLGGHYYNFYDVLQWCNLKIPENEKINLIVPTNSRTDSAFLEGKGRYYLYPRNYGDNKMNANFILVYSDSNFKIPPTFEQCMYFGQDEYLLVKKEFNWKAQVCHVSTH